MRDIIALRLPTNAVQAIDLTIDIRVGDCELAWPFEIHNGAPRLVVVLGVLDLLMAMSFHLPVLTTSPYSIAKRSSSR